MSFISYKKNGAMRFISVGPFSITIVKRKAPKGETRYQQNKGRPIHHTMAWARGFSAGWHDRFAHLQSFSDQ